MKRLSTLVAVAIGLTAFAAACRQFMPVNRYLQPRESPKASLSTRDALTKFDHTRHAATFKAAHVTCLECHRFNELIDASNDDMARELSMRGLYPGGAACHYCHRQGDTHMASAPSACTTCHTNLLAIKPANHDVGWLKVHATVSQANSAECQNCHRQSFCIDCHERRDTIQTRVHERNFFYTHSIQARANPMQCGSCHRVDFCINCHQQGKIGP